MNARKIAATLAAAGLAVGLIGAGVSAQWTDSATAQAGVSVGTFACTISSPNAGAVISNNGHTVSWTMPEIQNSGQGPYEDFSIDLKNTGSMPERVSWTIEGPTYANSHLGVTSGSPDMHTPINVAPGAVAHYDYLGFQIADPTLPGDPNHGHPLDNNDLGRTFTATYTAACGEMPPPSASHISFVGVSGVTNSANGLQAVATTSNNVDVATFQGAGSFVTGNQNGNGKILFSATGPYALLVQTGTTGSALITCTTRVTTTFSGCTTTSGSGLLKTGNSVEIAPMTLSLPGGWQAGDLAVALTVGDGVPSGFAQLGLTVQSTTKLSARALVAGDSSLVYSVARGSSAGFAVYRGASGVGANTSGTINQMVPLVCRGLTTANGAPMVKTDGSSWVGCFAHDSSVSTNVGVMGFPGTTARTASGGQIGLSDTNAPVAAWANSAWQGNWPASHFAEAYSFEILSN